MRDEMTPMERTLATLQHKEPDRVPLFLNLTMHGARLMGVPIRKYFSDPAMMAKAQIAMGRRYGNDCCNAFTYSSAEFEAFGGETMFYEDGPPNSGNPVIRSFSDIDSLEVPDIDSTPSLMVTLEATKLLKEKVGNDVPILGVIISPFSLPVMQMGFENYFELMFTDPARLRSLMKVNQSFEVEFANRQLEAGATVIVYFDPVSSTTIIPRDKFIETGFKVAKSSIRQIKGPVAIHFASGRFTPIIDKVLELGVIGVGVSGEEDLAQLKSSCGNKLTLIGNLNGVEMASWTEDDISAHVREAMAKAARGGGFILSDNHGEIPYQVSEGVLDSLSAAARKFGTYGHLPTLE